MLEAYSFDKNLDLLEARLADETDAVQQELLRLLEGRPKSPRALLLLARTYSLGDQVDDAKRVLETLLELEPQHALAKLELASICLDNDDAGQAVTLLTEVTNTSPEIAEAWRLLRDALQQAGQADESQQAAEQYAMIKAFNVKLDIAAEAVDKGDFKTVDEISRHLLELVPNETRASRMLTRVARQFGHFEFSTATLAGGVAGRPGDIPLGIDYARSLLGSRMYQEVLSQCQRLIAAAPEVIDLYEIKAEALFNLGQYDAAIEIYRELATLDEKKALSLLHLGKVLRTIGKADEAATCYQDAIDVDPTLGQAYWELADLKTYRFTEDEIASMRALLQEDEIPAMDRVLIDFALGKALEDAEEFAASFAHYESANNRYHEMRPPNASTPVEQFKSTFSAEYFAERSDGGDPTDAPIFVVGLPRSGTTLLEQILSSHSQVDPTQELDEIVSIARTAGGFSEYGPHPYPQCMLDLSAEQVREFASRYMAYARSFRGDAPRFVDKAPHNFLHIGLIKTLFPNATIIDVRRNPMASGWSLYRQFFSDSFLFSYDLESIGQYFNDYAEIMQHWHTVLPGQVLTLRYEDLVNDFRGALDTVLQHCGLEFEDACLDFHLNRRAVATPSAEQVRQPLYRDALAHWENYEAHLSPLQQALKDPEQFSSV